MENINLKKLYFGLLVLNIIITTSASNGYRDGTETESSDMTLINDSRHEVILGLLKNLYPGLNDNSIVLPLPLPLVEKINPGKTYKSRKAKTKSNFRIFNMNSLFNPAGLWE